MRLLLKTCVLLLLCTLVACGEDEPETASPVADIAGPEITNLRWIDHPRFDDPSGPIEDGGTYQISIANGFQMIYTFRDASNLRATDCYILVNDDPTLREDILTIENLGYREGTSTFTHRVGSFWIGPGEFYDLQPGDTYHFYFNVDDEFGNATSMSWTADLVE